MPVTQRTASEEGEIRRVFVHIHDVYVHIHDVYVQGMHTSTYGQVQVNIGLGLRLGLGAESVVSTWCWLHLRSEKSDAHGPLAWVQVWAEVRGEG